MKYGYYYILVYTKEECAKGICKAKNTAKGKTTTTGDKSIIITHGNIAGVKTSGNSNSCELLTYLTASIPLSNTITSKRDKVSLYSGDSDHIINTVDPFIAAMILSINA
jgi:hypothetical protein